jgi:hypothetical protein
MLREGLAAEFPSAKRAVDRLRASIRSTRVSRETPVWAALSAFGAIWAVGVIGQPLATGLRVAGLRDPASWLSGGFAVLGYALAVAVALRAGGRRGLAWYVAILAARTGLQIATALPGFLAFCERSLGVCTPMQFVLPYVYLAAGVLLGAGAVRAVRSGAPGPNAFLNGSGIFVVLVSVVGLVFFFVRPQDLVAASAMAFVLDGGAALAAGIVLRLRSARLAPAAFVTAGLLVTWLAAAGPFVFSIPQAGLSQPAPLYLSGLTNALALVVGWFATDRRQRARTTAAA